MALDLKLDILYYQTSTDFEMEFNLSGCCTMRLLSAKVDSPKEFLTALSRAVSRSRIIITVGSFTSDNSALYLSAGAVGLKLCEYDHELYNVKNDADRKILLPSGALPLVSSNGTLCGCLIESGPQIIIFLSDDKALRKNILKELVYDYIKALSVNSETDPSDIAVYADTPTAQAVEVTDTEDIAEATEISEDEETIDEDPVAEDADVLNNKTDYENEPSSDAAGSFEPNAPITDENPNDVPLSDFNDIDDIDDESNPTEHNKKNLHKHKFLGLKIAIGCLCAALAVVIGLLLYYYI